MHITATIAIIVLGSLFSGCAVFDSTSAYLKDEPYEPNVLDPFETENRAIYAFNDTVDRAVLKPTAELYRDYTPEPVQGCVSNIFSNLKEPIRVVSHAITVDGQGVANSTVRFFINTVVGGLGCFDAAGKSMKIERKEKDLGLAVRSILNDDQQLFIMVPLLGPSTLVDAGGSYVGNEYLNPFDATLPESEGGKGLLSQRWDDNNPYSTRRNGLRNIYLGVNVVKTRAELLDVTDVLDTAALDPYAFVRDGYLQRRAALAEEIRER